MVNYLDERCWMPVRGRLYGNRRRVSVHFIQLQTWYHESCLITNVLLNTFKIFENERGAWKIIRRNVFYCGELHHKAFGNQSYRHWDCLTLFAWITLSQNGHTLTWSQIWESHRSPFIIIFLISKAEWIIISIDALDCLDATISLSVVDFVKSSICQCIVLPVD